jgi:hypothetical protein
LNSLRRLLDGRKDHFERRQIAAQVIETKNRIVDFTKQRLALIRADHGAVSAHTAFRSSLAPFRLRFGRYSLTPSLTQITSAFSNRDSSTSSRAFFIQGSKTVPPLKKKLAQAITSAGVA